MECVCVCVCMCMRKSVDLVGSKVRRGGGSFLFN